MNGGVSAFVWVGPGDVAEVPYESIRYLRACADTASTPPVIWAWDLPESLRQAIVHLLGLEERALRALQVDSTALSATGAGDLVLFSSGRLRAISDLQRNRSRAPQVIPEDLDLNHVRIGDELRQLHDLTVKLRMECPWDREQTQPDIITHTLEEVYELADALAFRGSGRAEKVRGELGDLLFQVYFLARVADEEGLYDLGDVAAGIRDKLMERHPHIFGDSHAETPEDVKETWEEIKKRSEGREGIFHDVPGTFPAQLQARKLQQRAASVGFDWEKAGDVLSKIREELGELVEALPAGKRRRKEEVGDLLFAVVNLARKLEVDPELALRASSQRFRSRVERAAELAEAEGKSFSALDLNAKESYYRRAKQELRKSGGGEESE